MWVGVVVTNSVAAMVVAAQFAPSAGAAPDHALGSLLVVGASMHVAATLLLFQFAEVRRHAGGHPRRYVFAPVTLVVIGALTASLLPTSTLRYPLLAYFGWQFTHYQKQGLGIAALAASSYRVSGLSIAERRLILAAGWVSVARLMLNPSLLQLPPTALRSVHTLNLLAAVAFAIVAAAGVVMFARRDGRHRPPGVVAAYLLALLFPLPMFLFTSPYPAVAGMTIAHGLQYLVLVGMVTVGPATARPTAERLLMLLTGVLFVGVALNLASHLHSGGPIARAGYGAYLGLVMTHFVVDAGLWRLSDEFPRRFLTSRLPTLLVRPTGD